MELIDYLRLARELTGASDVKELMISAKFLQAEMNPKPIVEPRNDTTSTSWLTVRTVADFISNVKIQHPIKGALPFVPYPFQEGMARSIEDTDKKIVLVNSARQMGNSATLSALALYRAVTRPDHTVLILANKFVAALEIMNRIRTMVETCELPLPFVKEFNKGSIQFNNGSRIIARAVSKDAGRGLSVDTVMVHDAAYISWSVEKDWWASIQPMLNKGSQIILSSCPNVTKGLFYDLWENDTDQLVTLKLKYIWSDHPDRDETWAKYMKNQLGSKTFSREYEGVFLKADDEV
jgi:hypothetical protein